MNKDLEIVFHFVLRYGLWILAMAWIVAAISREIDRREPATRPVERPDRRKLLLWVLLGLSGLGVGFFVL